MFPKFHLNFILPVQRNQNTFPHLLDHFCAVQGRKVVDLRHEPDKFKIFVFKCIYCWLWCTIRSFTKLAGYKNLTNGVIFQCYLLRARYAKHVTILYGLIKFLIYIRFLPTNSLHELIIFFIALMYVKLDANWFTSLSINGWCSHLKLNQLLRVSMKAVLFSCSFVFECIKSEIESPEIELMFTERNYLVDFCNIDRLVSSVTVFCQGCIFRNRMLDDNHEDEERN